MHIRMPDVHVGVKTGCIIYTDHEMFLHFYIQYIILARNLVLFCCCLFYDCDTIVTVFTRFTTHKRYMIPK